MSDLVIETSGLRKVYRSGGRRIVAVDGLDLSVAARRRARVPRPQRLRQDHHDQDAARPGPAHQGRDAALRAPGAGPAARRSSTASAPSSRSRGSSRRSPGARTSACSRGRSACRARRSTRCCSRSASPTARGSDYKGYSLGMKQRLAIAAALLKSPDLLILDEPTNGLDPAGIRGIRELIRDLGESGVTVLLSSHILAEVQQVCHSVSIVGDGRLLASRTGRGPARRERLPHPRRRRRPAGRASTSWRRPATP